MNRWDVYWADVPFEDAATQSKMRPVVIARDMTVYVLTLKVTSHDARDYDPYDYTLQYWQEAGLDRKSVVRIRKLSQLKPGAIKNKIGHLHRVDIVEIQRHMQRYLEEIHAK